MLHEKEELAHKVCSLHDATRLVDEEKTSIKEKLDYAESEREVLQNELEALKEMISVLHQEKEVRVV